MYVVNITDPQPLRLLDCEVLDGQGRTGNNLRFSEIRKAQDFGYGSWLLGAKSLWAEGLTGFYVHGSREFRDFGFGDLQQRFRDELQGA